jgi:hypothetical protein
MYKITIGIQPLAELRAEMLAVARGERKSDPDAPQVCFESLPALAKALRTDVATSSACCCLAPTMTCLDQRRQLSAEGFLPLVRQGNGSNVMPERRRSSPTPWGREDSLALAAGATGSARPRPATDVPELTAAKRTVAACDLAL